MSQTSKVRAHFGAIDIGNEMVSLVYGTEFSQEVNIAESTTSNTAFTNKMSLSTASIPAGTYRVGWYYNWAYSVNTSNFLARVQIDDTTTIHEQTEQPTVSGNSQENVSSGFGYVTFSTNATHTIDLEFAASNGAHTSYIKNSRLEFWRVT